MTIYKLRKKPKQPKVKEGDIKKVDNFTYQFIVGKWREIYHKCSDGFERWSDYDNRGEEIHFKTTYGECFYDDEGEIITKKEFNKIWEEVE